MSDLFADIVREVVRTHEPKYLKPDIRECYRDENTKYYSGKILLLFENEQDPVSLVNYKENAEQLMQKLTNITEQVFGKCASISYYYGKKSFIPEQQVVEKFQEATK